MKTLTILCALAGSAVSAQDHNHITVNTDGTNIQMEIGYLPSESAFALAPDGQVLRNGEIMVYTLESQHDGWYFDQTGTLTTDFYAATGNLDGGNFLYEITNVAPVGGGASTIASWGFEGHGGAGGYNPVAFSDGASQLERSLEVGGPGNHPHGQKTGVRDLGVYDITLVAWDSAVTYWPSQPVTIRVNAIPAPASAALLGLGGIAAVRRRR